MLVEPRIVFDVCECLYGDETYESDLKKYLEQHGLKISSTEMMISGRLCEDTKCGEVLYSGGESVLKVKRLYAYGHEFEELSAGMTCAILADRTEHSFQEFEKLYDKPYIKKMQCEEETVC